MGHNGIRDLDDNFESVMLQHGADQGLVDSEADHKRPEGFCHGRIVAYDHAQERGRMRFPGSGQDYTFQWDQNRRFIATHVSDTPVFDQSHGKMLRIPEEGMGVVFQVDTENRRGLRVLFWGFQEGAGGYDEAVEAKKALVVEERDHTQGPETDDEGIDADCDQLADDQDDRSWRGQLGRVRHNLNC